MQKQFYFCLMLLWFSGLISCMIFSNETKTVSSIICTHPFLSFLIVSPFFIATLNYEALRNTDSVKERNLILLLMIGIVGCIFCKDESSLEHIYFAFLCFAAMLAFSFCCCCSCILVPFLLFQTQRTIYLLHRFFVFSLCSNNNHSYNNNNNNNNNGEDEEMIFKIESEIIIVFAFFYCMDHANYNNRRLIYSL